MQTDISIKGLLCLALGFSISITQAAELYRWSDEDGKVHYTDRVPAKYVERGYRVISKQGLTIHTIKAVADEPKIVPEEVIPQLSEEQKARDRALLMSYGSELEIQETRDRKIEELQSLIVLNKENSRVSESQFRELTRKAGDYEKQGKKIPDSLLTKINATNQKIRSFSHLKTQRVEEIKRTIQQFEKDIKRYQALQQNDKPLGPETEITTIAIEETFDLEQQIKRLELEISKQNRSMLELENRFKLKFNETQRYQKSGRQAPPGLNEEIVSLKLKIQQGYVEALQNSSQLQSLKEQLDFQQ